ncbi:hypothetical protein ACFE04_015561 [Oxalis oulophora]
MRCLFAGVGTPLLLLRQIYRDLRQAVHHLAHQESHILPPKLSGFSRLPHPKASLSGRANQTNDREVTKILIPKKTNSVYCSTIHTTTATAVRNSFGFKLVAKQGKSPIDLPIQLRTKHHAHRLGRTEPPRPAGLTSYVNGSIGELSRFFHRRNVSIDLNPCLLFCLLSQRNDVRIGKEGLVKSELKPDADISLAKSFADQQGSCSLLMLPLYPSQGRLSGSAIKEEIIRGVNLPLYCRDHDTLRWLGSSSGIKRDRGRALRRAQGVLRRLSHDLPLVKESFTSLRGPALAFSPL